MPIQSRKVMLFKEEVTYNTDPVPAAGTDAVLAEEITWSMAGDRRHVRNPVKPALGKLKDLFAGTLIQITANVEIKGSGAAGTPPEFAAMLRACALSEAIVASTSVTYTPLSDVPNHKSGTLYLYEDGLFWPVTGCRGNVSGTLAAGAAGMLTFTMTGHLAANPTDVALPAQTVLSLAPRIVNPMPIAVDSFNPVISKLDFDLGNDVQFPDSVASSDSYGTINIVKRNTVGNIDPLLTLVADYDWWGKMESDAVFALDTGVIGSTAGNRYQITAPAVGYNTQSPGNRAEHVTRDVPLEFTESSGDDEISLVFT